MSFSFFYLPHFTVEKVNFLLSKNFSAYFFWFYRAYKKGSISLKNGPILDFSIDSETRVPYLDGGIKKIHVPHHITSQLPSQGNELCQESALIENYII